MVQQKSDIQSLHHIEGQLLLKLSAVSFQLTIFSKAILPQQFDIFPSVGSFWGKNACCQITSVLFWFILCDLTLALNILTI